MLNNNVLNYKELLSQSSNVIHLDNQKDDCMCDLKIGNNDFVFRDTVLKSFCIHNTLDKLYVFLSAVGKQRDRYPIFHRVSWHDKFDGIKIFFDDPTRNELKFSPAFYFGKLNSNYLDYIKTVVEKLKLHFKLSNDKITFISSSNGGFGGIYLSNEFVGSNCIALCPQLDVKLFFDESKFNVFKEKTEVHDENSIDVHDRLNLWRIINNKSSKFIIYSNIACFKDRQQIDSFCKNIHYEYKQGINRVSDNFYLILTSFDNVDPHNVQPDENFCGYLASYFWLEEEKKRISMVNYFINLMKKSNETDFKMNLVFPLLSLVKSPSKLIIKRKDDNTIDIYFNNSAFVRVKNSKKNVIPSLRLKKNVNSTDMNKIYKYVKTSNSLIDEDENWVNIYKNPIPAESYFDWIKEVNDAIKFIV